MKLRRLKIKNFRGIYDLSIDFNNFTVLIGRNNSGKTSILDAIRIVFENLDQDVIKTFRYEGLNLDVKDQILGLWFFKNYKSPIEIKALVEFDPDEADEKLKELCKLKEEVKGAWIEVRLELLEDQGVISWKLDKLDLLGFVSKTPEKALQLLEAIGGGIKDDKDDILSRCRVVDGSKIVNSNIFNKVLSILRGKVHTIAPFYINPDLAATNMNIRAIFRRTLVSKDLIEDLKKVLEDHILKDFFYKYTERVKGVEYGYIYVDHKSKMYEREQLRFELFGGGEQALDCLIAALLSKGQGHIFLIEEPETHMHPAYIKGFARVLEEIVNERNIQVVTITQSPEFVASIENKSAIIGVRKRYVNVYATSKPVTEIYRPYSEREDKYLIETLAHELGIPPGHFFFTNVAILVEGRSDKIVLQHFINLLKDAGRLMHLPRTHYDVVEYRKGNLKALLETLRERFKVKIFVIADNDDQGQESAKIAKEIGLQENIEVFVLSKKDILCYIPPKIAYNALIDTISNVLRIDMNKLKRIKIQIKKKDDEHEKVREIEALKMLDEIKRYGIVKGKTDLLRLLINRGIFKEVSDKVLNARGWNRKDLYHTLKPIIAEKAMKEMNKVPDEIERILAIIDNNVREAVQI